MPIQNFLNCIIKVFGTFTILICACSFCYAQAHFGARPISSRDSIEKAFAPNDLALVVEEQPTYPGGDSELIDFIRKHTVRPSGELDSLGITGTVYVSFVVTKDGENKFFHIQRGLSPKANAEALRVARLMPHWSIGRTQKQPVNSRVTIPISFKKKGIAWD